MYGYGYHRHRWVPMLLLFFVVFMLFSGGFHRMWFFVWPLFCIFPLFIAGGMAFMFAKRGYGWHGDWPKFKHSEMYNREYYREKPKRDTGGEPPSDIYYV